MNKCSSRNLNKWQKWETNLDLQLPDGESDGDAAVVERLLQGGDLAVVDADVAAELGAANEVVGRQLLHAFEITVGKLEYR